MDSQAAEPQTQSSMKIVIGTTELAAYRSPPPPSACASCGTPPPGLPVYEIVLAGTLGPLIAAFCTELGKRLGGTVADWASRIKVRVPAQARPVGYGCS